MLRLRPQAQAFAGLGSALALGLLLACAKPPVITSLTADPNPVAPDAQTELTAVASSPNGEALTCHWYVVESGSGTLSQGTGNPVTWSAGKLAGTYHVALRVLDEHARVADDTLAIQVASP
jgi:hypothetical protein